MPIASSRPLSTSTWRPFAMSHSQQALGLLEFGLQELGQQELGQHVQALGALLQCLILNKNATVVILWSIYVSSRPLRKLKALSSGLGYDLIIFSSHGFKCKCKIRCFILSREATTAQISTKAVKVGAMTRRCNVFLHRCNSPLQYTTPFTRLHLRGDDKRLRLG